MNRELWIPIVAGLVRHLIAALGIAGAIKSDQWYYETASILVTAGAVLWSAIDKRRTVEARKAGDTQIVNQ